MGENQPLALAVLKGPNLTRCSNINFYCGDNLKVLVCTDTPPPTNTPGGSCPAAPAAPVPAHGTAPGRGSGEVLPPPSEAISGAGAVLSAFRSLYVTEDEKSLKEGQDPPQWLTGTVAVGWEVQLKCWAETRAHGGMRSWSFCPHGSGTAQRRTAPPAAADEEWTRWHLEKGKHLCMICTSSPAG